MGGAIFAHHFCNFGPGGISPCGAQVAQDTTVMFQHYIQKLQQAEPCWPLCHRGFDAGADRKDLVNEVSCAAAFLTAVSNASICVHHVTYYYALLLCGKIAKILSV
jgi:hypothetical protein